jgi:hypothetical protein
MKGSLLFAPPKKLSFAQQAPNQPHSLNLLGGKLVWVAFDFMTDDSSH